MIYSGDCLDIMPSLDADSVDAIVTDPPYGLSFMGKEWDHGIPGVAFWKAALRIAKPGCHLLAFGGTRTFHRLVCAIEDAGWEIRDTVMWVYGSGFPKSLNVGKAVDKLQGNKREDLGIGQYNSRRPKPTKETNIVGAEYGFGAGHNITKGHSQWEGFGTALKPAWEPIIVARKPLEGTVALNVLKWGCGALNIDKCRIGTETMTSGGSIPDIRSNNYENSSDKARLSTPVILKSGRWPSNFIHDGSQGVLDLFPVTKSGAISPHHRNQGIEHIGTFKIRDRSGEYDIPASSGSAARFFYCAKASKADRNEGLDDPGFQFKHGATLRKIENTKTSGNNHPTVKPTPLMRYLCRLVTPPNGIILDPFMGSGSTGKAAKLEGFRFIGIELEPEYVEIARARMGV